MKICSKILLIKRKLLILRNNKKNKRKLIKKNFTVILDSEKAKVKDVVKEKVHLMNRIHIRLALLHF